MKKLFLSLSLLVLVAVNSAHAVAISLASTSVGHRFFLPGGVIPVSSAGFIEAGFMSDPTDASTFKVFGSAAIHGNSAFPDGLGNAALNTTDAQTTSAAAQSIYIRVYNGATLGGSANAGIWKSTSVLYPADFAPSSTNGAAVSLATDAWAVVIPASNWAFTTPNAAFQANGATGIAGGTPRTGNVFTLGAAVPEPSVTALLGLLGLVGLRRKR